MVKTTGRCTSCLSTQRRRAPRDATACAHVPPLQHGPLVVRDTCNVSPKCARRLLCSWSRTASDVMGTVPCRAQGLDLDVMQDSDRRSSLLLLLLPREP